MKRFVLRKIRNGSVRILGHQFVPDRRPDDAIDYDGRLDGKVMAFALYWSGDRMAKGHDGRHFVSLWGTEKAYKFSGDRDEATDEECDWPGPNCIDGKFYWEWWHEVVR